MLQQCIEDLSDLLVQFSKLEMLLYDNNIEEVNKIVTYISNTMRNVLRNVVYLQYHDKYERVISIMVKSFVTMVEFKLMYINKIYSLNVGHIIKLNGWKEEYNTAGNEGYQYDAY
jgi:hypothetical protein